ncbi:MAG: NAD(P)-binding domain-containing protein, partial [Balneolaceae bacterium]|nr:NAD(P)-binding domain-containing protein [Balneolaceae bacterium]
MGASDIGVCGLGVMGNNLALNLEEHGYRVSVYNRSAPGEEHLLPDFMDQHGDEKNFGGFGTINDFIASLSRPRIILILVKAGDPVDAVIGEMRPRLERQDILIDGGNSHYSDTARRVEALAEEGILFVGMGVSGGEEGARHGPSLMPGGAPEAWEPIRDILTSIAADAPDGTSCCDWIGVEGAGHFVKMVHNGIEYADMQFLSEAYYLMKNGLGMESDEIAARFRQWNEGPLNSYLTEITADIFSVKD